MFAHLFFFCLNNISPLTKLNVDEKVENGSASVTLFQAPQ